MPYYRPTVVFQTVQVTLGCLRSMSSRCPDSIRRWFNEVRAYNVSRGQVPVAAPVASPFPPTQAQPDAAAAAPFPPAPEAAPAENSADDLPF